MSSNTRPISDTSILEALNDTILAFRAQEASEYTVQQYRLIIGRLFYFRFLKPRGVLLLRDITPHLVTEWLTIRRQQVGHRTVDSNFRVLRAGRMAMWTATPANR